MLRVHQLRLQPTVRSTQVTSQAARCRPPSLRAHTSCPQMGVTGQTLLASARLCGGSVLLANRQLRAVRTDSRRAVRPCAMVNVELSPATYLGVVLIGGGLTLMQIRSSRPVLSRDTDIIAACISILAGSILIFQGWRLDPILLFEQLLIASTALAFGVETLKLRAKVTDQLEEAALQQAVEQDAQQRALPPPVGATAPWMQQVQQQQQGPWQGQQGTKENDYASTAAAQYAPPTTSGRPAEQYYDGNSGQWYPAAQRYPPRDAWSAGDAPANTYYAGTGSSTNGFQPPDAAQQAWQAGAPANGMVAVPGTGNPAEPRPNSPGNPSRYVYQPESAGQLPPQPYQEHSWQMNQSRGPPSTGAYDTNVIQQDAYGTLPYDGGSQWVPAGGTDEGQYRPASPGEVPQYPSTPPPGQPGNRAARGPSRGGRAQQDEFSIVDDWN